MQKQIVYTDSEGNRLYTVQQATRLVEGVSQGTMWGWAARGVTSFGFELDVTRQPMVHRKTTRSRHARWHLESRMLIPEAQVLAVREILHKAGRTKPATSSYNKEENDTLELTFRYFKHRNGSANSPDPH